MTMKKIIADKSTHEIRQKKILNIFFVPINYRILLLFSIICDIFFISNKFLFCLKTI